jgi:hypothetical protein
MHMGKNLPAFVLLACAATATRAEVIDIAWSSEGRFEQRKDIPAGKFIEVCGKLAANIDVQWSFEAGGPLDFNIHYHEGEKVLYPATLSKVSRGGQTLRATVEQDYCWMWTNRATATIELSFRLTRQARD